MSKTLLQRFTYGNFSDLPTLSAESDFFLGGPARQRELLLLARTQIELTRDATAAVRESARETASALRRELENQTNTLSDVIRMGADSIASSIDSLADRLSAELVEIRWELIQIRSANEQMLDVLKRPRSTEAQELLQQGIRNLVNNKLEEAEDRFLRAIDLDNTDFQVLVNLSAVELRKGNAERATSYLQDALTLPEHLSDSARAEALWLLARVHYAQEDYRTAAKIAKESVALLSTPRRLLQYGEYLVLATNGNQGFSTIETAIRREPNLFGLAAISSDLASHNDALEALLTSLLREIVSELRATRDELLLQIPKLGSLSKVDTRQVVAAFQREVNAVGLLLDEASYPELRGAREPTQELRKVLSAFERLSRAEHAVLSATEQHRKAAEQLSAAKAALARCPKVYKLGDFALLGCLGLVGSVIAMIVVLGLIFDLNSANDKDVVLSLFFLGIFGIPTLLLLRAIDGQRRRTKREREHQAAEGGFRTADSSLVMATIEKDDALRQAVIPRVSGR